MGDMQVPVNAYYGAQTARAVENFPISSLRFQRPFIRAMGLIKKHAAITNAELGQLDARLAKAIESAAQEVADGTLDSQFLLDIFQTGSGTSTNMNANEVIANRAIELLGGKRGEKTVHPNDHVNKGQSSNDVIPSAIHIAALDGIRNHLTPALKELRDELNKKTRTFDSVLKIGRTHLQDATPIRLGQEFGGYSSQVEHDLARLTAIEKHLGELALGGTAIGTGINTHPEFARRTIQRLASEMGLPLVEAPNHFEAQGAIDACVEASGALKTIAVSLIKIANDIRWLGVNEIKIPATQPGSSIMPGKVNPVMSEMLIQVGAQVIGSDAAMMPVIAYNLLLSIELLTNGARVFARRCVAGLEANVEACAATIERSLAMCTALAPVIGYDKAAKIAKIANETHRTVREVAYELSGLSKDKVNELLEPRKQTGP